MTKPPPAATSGWSLQPTMDWLFTKDRMIGDNNRFTLELATRLVESGAPIDGLRIMVRTLNPQVLAYTVFWFSSDNAAHTVTARHGVRNTDRYIGSPLQVVLEEHRSLHQPLGDLPENPHAAYAELIGHGHTDYLGLPIELSDGAFSAIIFTTRNMYP